MNKLTVYKILPHSVFWVALLSIQGYTSLKIGNTAFWWIIQFLILIFFWKYKSLFFDKSNSKNMLFVQTYLVYNLFSIIRGFFIAETYWDWKGLLSNGFALLLPIVAYAATDIDFIKRLIKKYITISFPLFFLFYFFISNGAKGFYLVPMSFLALFLPVIKGHWKWIVLGCCILIVFLDLAARSNVIKFGLPVVLSLIYYLRNIISTQLLEYVRKLLFVIPIILFCLALNGTFNIFNLGEYLNKEYTSVSVDADGQITEENLTSDTRTPLYIEVLQTANKHNTWILGRSPARGNESELFANLKDITGREERQGNEVAILNIFTWTGIIGVILYFFVFYQASFLALQKIK